jgi:hypothetical protein
MSPFFPFTRVRVVVNIQLFELHEKGAEIYVAAEAVPSTFDIAAVTQQAPKLHIHGFF